MLAVVNAIIHGSVEIPCRCYMSMSSDARLIVDGTRAGAWARIETRADRRPEAGRPANERAPLVQFTRTGVCPESMLGPCTRRARACVHIHVIKRSAAGPANETERAEERRAVDENRGEKWPPGRMKIPWTADRGIFN